VCDFPWYHAVAAQLQCDGRLGRPTGTKERWPLRWGAEKRIGPDREKREGGTGFRAWVLGIDFWVLIFGIDYKIFGIWYWYLVLIIEY
jgi:hypothetical protein